MKYVGVPNGYDQALENLVPHDVRPDHVLIRIFQGYRPDTAEGLLHMSGAIWSLGFDQHSEGEFLNIMLPGKGYV